MLSTDTRARYGKIGISIFIGIFIGYVSFVFQSQVGFNDLWIAHCAARNILTDPYACPTNGFPSNPLTTSLFLLPLAGMHLHVAGGVFVAISTGVLAYALIRHGEYWRFLVFLSFPFWYAVAYVQWSPLLLAVAFLPALYPLVVAKPHIGIPIALMHFTPKRALITSLIVLCSLIIRPAWPWEWIAQTGSYDGMIPMAILPFGPILLLSLWHWRSPTARWLLLYALTPQRWWHDQLMIWILPQTRQQMLLLTCASWICHVINKQGATDLSVVLLYLVGMGVVFWQSMKEKQNALQPI